jgi:CheY-like chemotaxis protein
VLVVDDEPDVRAWVAEILRGSGYRVVAAPDGDAALAFLERGDHAVDVLVTDVVMPVMSGTDLAERVSERSPGTRVLFVSGYVPAGSAALRGAPLVTKPLHRTELLDAVRALVDG